MRIAKVERKIEYFPIIGEIKETNDEKYQIGGYLNYIGNIDYGDDETVKGAFYQTLKDGYARKSAQHLDFLWPYLWNHDYNILPPGGIYDADEDRKGLYTKTQFNPEIQLARELYASFKMGTMKKQSMGYKAIKVDWKTVDGRRIRLLQEVAIMEGSAVVFPMNDLAAVDTVKNSRKRIFVMPGQQKPQNKDFNDRYRAQVIDDWLCSDWYDLTTALRQSIQDLFASGDSPMQDLENIVLNDGDNSQGFLTALRNYVQEGIDLDYSNYLQEQDANSSGSDYYWMNNSDSPEAKAGRSLSAANHAILKKATDGITGHVKDIKSIMTSAMQQGYPRTMGAGDPPQQKDDADVSTHLDELVASLRVKNAFRGK